MRYWIDSANVRGEKKEEQRASSIADAQELGLIWQGRIERARTIVDIDEECWERCNAVAKKEPEYASNIQKADDMSV